MTKIESSPKFINALNSLYIYRYAVALFILIVLCYLVFFFRLGAGPVRQWDESSLAVNALEMTLNGNLLVKYLDGKPDLINTKPPLAIWLIAACMKYLGYHEFSLRLPSAISASITAIAIYIFSKQYLQDFKASLIAVLVLITSIGFTGEHVARTGDYDAMLVLWITIYSLAYFIYLHSETSKKPFYLAVITVALVFAVWTKGIAGLLALPGLLIYTAWQKKVRKLLLSPQVYCSGIIFLILALGYYLLTEQYNPGYLQAIAANELTGRYGDLVPGGTPRGFFYYLANIISYRFVPWIYVLPFCLMIVSLSEKKIFKDFIFFSSIYLTSYFLIISYSKTKFNWYDAPLYPIASLIIGLGFSIGFKLIADYCCSHNLFNSIKAETLFKRRLIYVVLISSIFLMPFFNNFYTEIDLSNVPFRENDWTISGLAFKYREYFTKLATAKLDIKTNKLQVVNINRYNLPLLFYTQAANLTSPYLLEVKWENPSEKIFITGETIVNCDANTQEDLNRRYRMRVLHSDSPCGTFLIENTSSKIKADRTPQK
ncbi:ArnT family glycosyltransferase [Microseira wollei]|uniref:Glycosyl transferase family protein n=1 Tax=Microseira wollei NIES-4236 TaxID=2530354 RepID=A0AAV3X5R8_9CYAN|nr:glycosyltransferase family 39 protein [Microseira wollei]GET35669.1 glycosyl transferase family protein [Microseira wollei NIES-4236]